MERLVITGATGMIGRVLVQRSIGKYKVTVISQNHNKARAVFTNPDIEICTWTNSDELIKCISGSKAVIHLAGSNIGEKRWTKKVKDDILNSRKISGEILTECLTKCEIKPEKLIQSSAIGYYTNSYTKIYTEHIECENESFLHEVTKHWEHSTEAVTKLGVGHIVARIGVVLAKNGGVFPRLVRLFKLYVGGRIGSGKQWFSWIHIEDLVRSLLFIVENKGNEGIFNIVSPNPVTNSELTKSLAKKGGYPIWTRLPSFALKFVFGQMAKETLLSSQIVKPESLLNTGFNFKFEKIESALDELLGK